MNRHVNPRTDPGRRLRWNQLAVFVASGNTLTVKESNLWGLDLSGTLQGAGGVGGLLAVSAISDPQSPILYPSYDGNGNIIAWTDSNGATRQRIDYDPFGNVVTRAGDSGFVAPAWGFSTKYQDKETGLLYYGFRFYDSVTGRWPSRDPIEENGGINLYGFVRNNAISLIDFLGLEVTQDATIGISRFLKNVSDWEASAFATKPDTSCEDRLKAFRDEIHKNNKFGSGGSFSADANLGLSNKDKLSWHYLYTSEGWIDLGHFSNAAHYQNYFGVQGAKVGGHGVESYQAFTNLFPGLPTSNKTSAFTREDYRSNRLGAEFGDFVDYMGWSELFGGCECRSLSDALNAFLSDYNPREDPSTAPDYKKLPPTQDDLDSRKYLENLGNAFKNSFVNGIPGYWTIPFNSSPAR